ncbi:TetR family transcriptional regulator [Paenibacillus aurantiacus]|uniref:TetR family transcriptional regulator n=1 Tax=Paenibacillus aurantiacus TaxID=1936118 RepID=A0ABV5KVL5_9BACL
MKPQQPGAEVKAKILAAAKALFAERGYEGTSVRDICERANVALALVSYHFGGKEGVFFAIFEPLQRLFGELRFDLSDPEAALGQFARRFVRYRHEEAELLNVLQQEMMMNSPRLPRLTGAIHPTWRHLADILRAGAAQGRFRFNSLPMATHFIVGTLIFSRMNPFVLPELASPAGEQMPLSQEEAAEMAVRYILQGLRDDR